LNLTKFQGEFLAQLFPNLVWVLVKIIELWIGVSLHRCALVEQFADLWIRADHVLNLLVDQYPCFLSFHKWIGIILNTPRIGKIRRVGYLHQSIDFPIPWAISQRGNYKARWARSGEGGGWIGRPPPPKF